MTTRAEVDRYRQGTPLDEAEPYRVGDRVEIRQPRTDAWVFGTITHVVRRSVFVKFDDDDRVEPCNKRRVRRIT